MMSKISPNMQAEQDQQIVSANPESFSPLI
jgi:hypothetical protein